MITITTTMKKKKRRNSTLSIFAVGLLSLSLISCATGESHQHVLGEVVTTKSPTLGVACLKGVKSDVGQRLEVVERVCRPGTYGNRWVQKPTTVCENVKKGEVEVVARTNAHEVELRALGGIELKPGFIVKRAE